MIIKILAIKDRQLDAFMRPFFMASIGAAVRGFQDEINRDDSEMKKHPDDYDLYWLGDWEDHTGKFIPNEIPEQVAIGKQLVK